MEDLSKLLSEWKGNKVLMSIYPHPDDETMGIGGLLMHAKSLGWKTIVVTLTRGGAGQIHTQAKGRTLKQIRESELRQALKILSVDHLELGDFDDGKMREQTDQWVGWLKDIIDKYNPGIVVTYDYSGLTGHPDHISLSVKVRELASKFILLWNTLPDNLAGRIAHSDVLDLVTKPTHILDLKGNWFRKWQAAILHKSQALGKDLPIPLWLAFAIYHYEWYHQVNPSGNYQYKFVDFKI